jgi:hypothetical protein
MAEKLTNDEIQRMWKEDVMAYFTILFGRSPGGNE